MTRRGFLVFLGLAPLLPIAPKYASGGYIRGGASDSVLVLLSPCEYRVSADTFKHYGADLLRALNCRGIENGLSRKA